MKSEIRISKFETNTNFELLKHKHFRILCFGHSNLFPKFACLREAPPPEALRRAGASAKAGISYFEFYEKDRFPNHR